MTSFLSFYQQDGNFSDKEDEKIINPFLEDLITFLLDFHDSQLKAVRFRTCQIITKLFVGLADNVEINEDLAERIYDCLVYRLADKIASIRVQAVLATWRLQDSEDETCPVITKFLELMEVDNNADVRVAALSNIALIQRTLEPVLGKEYYLLSSTPVTLLKRREFCSIWNLIVVV